MNNPHTGNKYNIILSFKKRVGLVMHKTLTTLCVLMVGTHDPSGQLSLALAAIRLARHSAILS
jgi:hypothetical protein